MVYIWNLDLRSGDVLLIGVGESHVVGCRNFQVFLVVFVWSFHFQVSSSPLTSSCAFLLLRSFHPCVKASTAFVSLSIPLCLLFVLAERLVVWLVWMCRCAFTFVRQLHYSWHCTGAFVVPWLPWSDEVVALSLESWACVGGHCSLILCPDLGFRVVMPARCLRAIDTSWCLRCHMRVLFEGDLRYLLAPLVFCLRWTTLLLKLS